MDIRSLEDQALHLEVSVRILAALPDDGTDRRLIRALRRDWGITRIDSLPVRAVAALQTAESRPGRLPEPILARLVSVVASQGEAHALFDYIHARAAIDRPGGGLLMMHRLLGATPFLLPEGVPDEEDGGGAD